MLPCLILGRERKGDNGLGSDTFVFPTSRHILESTGSIPENKEAGCTTHEYPRPVSLESSTCVHSRKGTSFSHTPFQAAVHEAAINKEWKNKQVAGKRTTKIPPRKREKQQNSYSNRCTNDVFVHGVHSVTGKPA